MCKKKIIYADICLYVNFGLKTIVEAGILLILSTIIYNDGRSYTYKTELLLQKDQYRKENY